MLLGEQSSGSRIGGDMSLSATNPHVYPDFVCQIEGESLSATPDQRCINFSGTPPRLSSIWFLGEVIPQTLPDLSWFFAESIPLGVRPLIASLLHPDPMFRPTATDASNHIWCRELSETENLSCNISASNPSCTDRLASGFETKDGLDDDDWQTTQNHHRISASANADDVELVFNKIADNNYDTCDDEFVCRLRCRTISDDTSINCSDDGFENKRKE